MIAQFKLADGQDIRVTQFAGRYDKVPHGWQPLGLTDTGEIVAMLSEEHDVLIPHTGWPYICALLTGGVLVARRPPHWRGITIRFVISNAANGVSKQELKDAMASLVALDKLTP